MSPAPEEFELVDAEAPDWVRRGRDRGDAGARRETATATPRAAAALMRRAERRARGSLARRDASPAHLAPGWASRGLIDLEYCVVDLETTGGGSDQDDEILEIGAVLVRGEELGREFSTLIAPSRRITRAARAVHGISDAALVGAPRLEHALPWLAEMARGRVLVFHNAGFDLPFLQRAHLETARDGLDQPVVDTLTLARRLIGPPAALALVAARLGLTVGVLHRALEDARTTARVLVDLLRVLSLAGAQHLADVPGVVMAPEHCRGRRHAQRDQLLERLERAMAKGEMLRLDYHAAAGVAPVELLVLPQRLVAGTRLQALDVERQESVWLEFDRVGRLRSAENA